MAENTVSIYDKLSIVGEATSVGRVRKANEDSMAVIDAGWIKVFAVCDGMGGHVGGKTASETAIAAISDYFLNNIATDPREAIYNAIVAANEAILNRAGQQPELSGMGSTCVMLTLTSDGKAYYGHVGDSRIYIIANHRITQLTKDHSVVQMMFDEGIIKTREDMEHHPRKNEITNALGMRHMQPPAVCSAPIEPEAGNCFLLCSDGLTGMVSDEQILRVISKHGIPIQQRAETLVQMANDNGGADNITVELVEFPNNVQDIVGGGRKKTFNRKKMILYTLPVLVILGGIAWYILTQVLHPKKPVEKEETEIFSEKTEPCTIYTADSVVFKKNTKCTANIPDFPKNDAVKQDSIKWDSRYIKTVEIEQDTITVVWREDAPLSNIEVTCETLAGKKCIIMIAIKQNVGLPESVQKDRKTKKLDAVTYQLETWIPVKIADKSIVLKKGQRAKTNDVQRVSCKVIDENTFNIKFLKKDYPDSVKVTIETEKVTYTFVIPVNPVQESENADENGADGKGDNRDKGATKTDPSNTLNLRNDSSTIEIIQY